MTSYSMDGSVGFLRFGEGTLATYGLRVLSPVVVVSGRGENSPWAQK